MVSRAGVTRADLAYWARSVPVRVLGAGLVVAAYRPWTRVHGPADALLFGCAVLFALWAAPPSDSHRPTMPSGRWSRRLSFHRTTVLPCAVVLLAALGTPRIVEAAATAALLTVYLAASDVRVLRVARPPVRAWLEPAGALAGSAVVVTASAASATGSAWARPVVALALAVGLAALLTGTVRRAAGRQTGGEAGGT
ncbi:hypothetical protein [Streptomyces sp. NPDC050145]|uniref:hypothetical protein n=1 Tax=Streptomyces sp. NPDC050145 TaxID=3365602 RepID=UPI0037961D3F